MTQTAQYWQRRYLAGDKGALGSLYDCLVRLARPTCWIVGRSLGLPMDPDRVEQVSHDAATCIVERYLRRPTYRIVKFATAVRYEVLYELTDHGIGRRPLRRMVQTAGELTGDLEAVVRDMPGDPFMYPQDILDDHARGGEILIALARGTTYPRAIAAVRQIATKQWCYDHAVKLRYVWKLTRRRPSEESGLHDSRRGRCCGSAEAVPRVRTDTQRRRD